MRIRSTGQLVAALVLATIGLNAAIVWRSHSEFEEANRERREASNIARTLSELRLATFEYRLYHHEQAVERWHRLSAQVDRAVGGARFSDPAQQAILAALQERQAQSPAIFAEVVAIVAARGTAPTTDASRALEAEALSRLVVAQQKTFESAFRLIDLATARIDRAQRLQLLASLAGLVVVALVITAGFLFLDRLVLAPVARLQRATQRVAAGDLDFTAATSSNDEIGALARDFDTMTGSLRASFARIENDRLEMAALNRDLDAFSLSVSHDLRSPLRAISGFTHLLATEHTAQLSPEARGYFERIRRNVTQMDILIDDLLSFSRSGKKALDRKPVALRTLVDRCLEEMAEDIATRAVRVEIGELPERLVDTALMGVVFQNLIGNAMKYTRRRKDAHITIGCESRDGERAIYVRDNGAGFDPLHATDLFGVFKRLHTSEEFEGTGIGLAIVKRIVERHGGRVWAEGRPGEGATFWFTVDNGPSAGVA